MICNASGIPLPMVEWSKNGNILPESQQVRYLSKKYRLSTEGHSAYHVGKKFKLVETQPTSFNIIREIQNGI